MTERARFTLVLRLVDHMDAGGDLVIAIGVDEQVRISTRDVEEIKAPVKLMPLSATVRLMKRRLFRKALFIAAAQRLGAQLAERMEDAEGWHDESRIAPAREQLGGRWR